MLTWIQRLLGMGSDRKAQSTTLDRMPTVATPAGYPPDLRLPKPLHRDHTPEQFESAIEAWRQSYRDHFSAVARFNRARAVRLGIKDYIWLESGPGLCKVAARNNGKRCSYIEAGPDGFAGEGSTCTSKDWCRCIAKSVVSGFD